MVGGDVGVVALPSAGHRDVQVLPIQAGPNQDDADVGGGALGAVDGGGPAVLAVLREVLDREGEPAAAGEVLHDQALLGAGAQDAVAVAVADMPVPNRQAPEVSGLPVPVPGGGDWAGDAAVGLRCGAGEVVEGVAVHPGPGEHEGVLPVGVGLGPVPEHPFKGGVAVGTGVQAALLEVFPEARGVALAELQACVPFPFLGEAVDLLEFDGVPGVGKGGEHPTRSVDDPDLSRVADQHDLRCGPPAAVVSRSRSSVEAMEVSSMITTVRSSKAVQARSAAGSCASRSWLWSHFARVSARPPVASASSAAARAEGASSTTR